MEKRYIIAIDQSTQATKALLLDCQHRLVCRCDKPHDQKVNEQGWVSHDLNEIYENTLYVVKAVVEKAEINKGEIACIGISNQRETTSAWNRKTGEPFADAIVWQCARAKKIEEHLREEGYSDSIKRITGLELSAYFPASKMAWLLQNISIVKTAMENNELCLGTIDSWLVYKLTNGASFKTDASNASRTQLMALQSLTWSEELCSLFGVSIDALPQICDSDSLFGMTDFEGYLEEKIPICGVLGDSHAALFAQGCFEKGMTKATYGTGTSVMMNIGKRPVVSSNGLATSLAWRINGQTEFVLEGNINYSGAIISWLINDLHLIKDAVETEPLAKGANPKDATYLVPAFSGLGAPYWKSEATAVLTGMSRTTGKSEIVKAAVEAIAYQITDIVKAMEKDAQIPLGCLKVDGGATINSYLMQFQSNILNIPICVSGMEELSGAGVAFAAGISHGFYIKDHLKREAGSLYTPMMDDKIRKDKYLGWIKAIEKAVL
jgi:glycerol kinase